MIIIVQLYAQKVIVGYYSYLKRAMCVSCRRYVDIDKRREGSVSCGRMWTGKGKPKTGFSCGRHKWMTP